MRLSRRRQIVFIFSCFSDRCIFQCVPPAKLGEWFSIDEKELEAAEKVAYDSLNEILLFLADAGKLQG